MPTYYSPNYTIQITKGSYSTVVSGNNIIVKVGSGSITLKNVKGRKINIFGTPVLADGLSLNSAKTVMTANKKFKGSLIDLSSYSAVKIFDGSKLSKTTKITGNANVNTISSGAGNDTIIGGKGNDSLTGGKGKDTFIYASGDGKDIITDYTAGQDKIKITSGKISKSKVSGKNVVFTIGSGSITVKNGKDKNITVIDSSGSTKTYRNNTSRNISELWFAGEENNFAQIDSRVEEKFAVADIQTENKITAQENLITFAK